MSTTMTPENMLPGIAWIVEAVRKPGDEKPVVPYLTLKREVAIKRMKAGDHVTPYHSKNELPQEEEL